MSVAIIQVRSSSKRFPNKVMTSINNKPLLYYVMSRVKRSKNIKKIIVACSVLKSDSSIARFCKENKYKIYRGSLNDVLDRYVKVCKKYKLKYFVRINGDSPCIDPNLVDKAIQIYKKKNCDIVTNVFPRSYPRGISVEVIKSKCVFDLNKKKISNSFREHITSYFYNNYKNYKIINFNNKKNFSKINLSVDTKSDLKKIRKAIINKNFLNMSWKKIVNITHK